MPTYKNNTTEAIYLPYDDIVIGPNETLETNSFYNIDGLELIDINPYIFPIEISENNTCSQSSPAEYYVLDKNKIRILPLSGDIRVYFNEYDSSNPDSIKYILLKQNMMFEITNIKQLIEKIFLTSDTDSETVQFYISISNKLDNYFNF